MNPAVAIIAVIFQATQPLNIAQTVAGELSIPQGRIHVQVIPQDVVGVSPKHHGSLSCLITANNNRLVAGQILQSGNACDFFFYNEVATGLLIYVQNGDDFPHDYKVVVSKVK